MADLHSDWRARLCALIDARRSAPFQWGVRDCCLFGADGVAAMTGDDLAHDLRGYAGPIGAARALRRAGFTRVRDVLAARLRPAARPAFGVIAMIGQAPLDCVLICDGAGAAWGQDDAGLVRVSLPPAAELWSV